MNLHQCFIVMLGPSFISSSASSPSSSSSARVALVTVVIVSVALTSVRALATSEPPFFYDCEDEGFFPHPKDCRKYFWCLDSGPANLGIVPHAFTCPSGLYFNTKTEACDYPANVPCANQPKSASTRTRKVLKKRPTSNSTTTTTPDPVNESDEIFITTANSEVTTTEVPTTLAPVVSRVPSRYRRPSSTASTARTTPSTTTTTTTTSTTTTTTTPAPVTASENDNLKQLLHLVESLGGVDKIKSLVDEKSVSGNSLSNNHDESSHEDTGRSPSSTSNVRVNSRPVASTPAPAFFSPSYETPNRPEFSRLVSSSLVTESSAIVSNSASNQVARHRRPQHQQTVNQPAPDPVTVAPVTANPFFSYADPSRTPASSDAIGLEEDFSSVNTSPLLPVRDTVTRSQGVSNNGNFFSFSYNTPGGRVSASQGPLVPRAPEQQANRNSATPSAASSLLPPSSPFVDFFSYNTPGRLPQSSTRADTFVTEPTIFLDEENNQDQVNSNNNNGRSNSNNNNFEAVSPRQPSVPNVVSNRNRLEQPLNGARVRSSTASGAARTGDRLNGSNNGGNFVRIRVSSTLPNGQAAPLNSPDSIRLSAGLTQAQPNTPNTSTGRRATRVRINGNSNNNANSFANQVSPAAASSSLPGNSFANAPAASASSFLPPSAPLPHESNAFPRANQPGVLYDEDHEHVNIPGESPVDSFAGTRKPSSQSLRRRPPQRAHLRNRPEENPVGNFVNLPPPNLQVDPIVDPAANNGNSNNGLPRPFPPKPSNPPPTRMPSGPLRQPGGQLFDTPLASGPRVLPHNVPLVTLPPWASSVTSNPLSLAPTASESPVTPSPLNDPSFRPGTVQYTSLNINQRPPQPSLDDLFYTDLPFFDMNGKDESADHNGNNNGPPVDHSPSFPPVSTGPVVPVTVPITSTTTTAAPTTVAPVPSETPAPPPRSSVNPTFSRGSDSLRTNSRQRDRSRSRGNVPAQSVDQSPRSPIVTAPPQVRQRRPQQQQQQQQQTQVTTPVAPAAASASSSANEPTGPPVAMMDSGNIKCTRRGVFIHPASCGQFVVCAPASRGSTSYRSYVHHCPAEQVFVEEVGRCRPGNKERCEVFTK